MQHINAIPRVHTQQVFAQLPIWHILSEERENLSLNAAASFSHLSLHRSLYSTHDENLLSLRLRLLNRCTALYFYSLHFHSTTLWNLELNLEILSRPVDRLEESLSSFL
jgi:hypothetical protein